MSASFSSWSIRNPVPSILLFILLSFVGLIGFNRLEIQDFPDMDLPTISVSAGLEGAAPAQLETEVARKLEDKLASLSKLDHINTKITDGSVALSITFQLDKNSEIALNEVRNAVDSARAELPASLAPPNVSKLTSAGSAMLSYTIESPHMDERDLSWFVDNDLSKALMSVKGVSSIGRVGGVSREILIELDPALMAGMGLSPGDVSSAIRNAQKDASGGRGDIAGLQQPTRVLAAVSSVDELRSYSVPLAKGGAIQLGQVANISDQSAERSVLAFQNKKPVIGFQVTKTRGFSDVTVSRSVRETLSRFQQAHPEVRITETNNSIDRILTNFKGSMNLLIEGAILAVIVVFWFLRDRRATFVSATALPLSVLPTFGLMYMMGFTLNIVTLLSLSLVIGILVDDAIVEIENISRHIAMGKSPLQAATEAADEIGLAVIATTFTLVAVFLPTAFMGGIPGLVFKQFGITASIAVLASLLVARLLTPMMAAYMLRPSSSHQDISSPLMERYLVWVTRCLGDRRRTMLMTALFLVVTLALTPLLPSGFVPASDNSQTMVKIELPPGSPLTRTTDVALRAVDIALEDPAVKSVFSSVGTAVSNGFSGGSATPDVRNATLIVSLKPRSERSVSQADVELRLRERLRNLAGARVSVGGGSSGEKLELTLASDDPIVLQEVAERVEGELRTIKNIGIVTSSNSLQRPEVIVRPDPVKASAYGVSTDAIAEVVRLSTYGDYSNTLSKLNLPQRQVPIRVRLDQDIRTDISKISQLRVPGTQGTVALSAVASIEIGSGPSEINRLDRYRNVTLSVELNGRALGEVQREAVQLESLRQLPPGVRIVEQGELQRMGELFSSFGFAMLIGIFCIYAVLVLLFHDFLQPATILSALPLSLGGAIFSLWITRSSFSMPSIIGLLMLMGIVTKNSILLVEYAVMARREHGMNRFDALIDACHKRARPIVMTTIAMGAGMLPNALGLGADPSFRQPMAIVVIGGLITSTVLCLVVVPVVFTYVDDFLEWLKENSHRFRFLA